MLQLTVEQCSRSCTIDTKNCSPYRCRVKHTAQDVLIQLQISSERTNITYNLDSFSWSDSDRYKNDQRLRELAGLGGKVLKIITYNKENYNYEKNQLAEDY